MTRKGIAKDSAFADWASKGKDAGFFKILAEALRSEARHTSPWNTGLEHHALMELGRVKAIEETLFRLVDPLGSNEDKPAPKLPSPSYGVKP